MVAAAKTVGRLVLFGPYVILYFLVTGAPEENEIHAQQFISGEAAIILAGLWWMIVILLLSGDRF